MKSRIIVLSVVFLFGLLVLPVRQPVLSNAAVPIPNIPACTFDELDTIVVYLNNINEDITSLNEAIDAVEIEQMKKIAIDMHQNWFEESPNIPYCAQGVHTRLLLDRMVETMVIASLAMSYADYDLAQTYAELIQTTGEDLGTYGEILSSYQ